MCKIILTISIISFASIILGFFSANLGAFDPIYNNAIMLISFMMTIFVFSSSTISNLLKIMEDTSNKKLVVNILKFNFNFSLILIVTSFVATIAISYIKLPICDVCNMCTFKILYDSFIIFTIGILLEMVYDSMTATFNFFNH